VQERLLLSTRSSPIDQEVDTQMPGREVCHIVVGILPGAVAQKSEMLSGKARTDRKAGYVDVYLDGSSD
jgi:hypothetical protein